MWNQSIFDKNQTEETASNEEDTVNSISPNSDYESKKAVDLPSFMEAIQEEVSDARKEQEVQTEQTGKTMEQTELTKQEQIKAIVRIMYDFNLTTQEVRKELTKYKRERNRVVPAKWKNPNGDEVWSGRGRRPLWFDKSTAIKLI